jgi:hypothetical protein
MLTCRRAVGAQSSIVSQLPGWTTGAGLEYKLTRNIGLGFEYGFIDLGSTGSATARPTTPIATSAFARSSLWRQGSDRYLSQGSFEPQQTATPDRPGFLRKLFHSGIDADGPQCGMTTLHSVEKATPRWEQIELLSPQYGETPISVGVATHTRV